VQKPIKRILGKNKQGTTQILKLLFICYLQIIKSREKRNQARSDKYFAKEENKHFHLIISSIWWL
jgi:hypothetical protein